MDGTFNITPRGAFQQVLIIYAQFLLKTFPLVFIVMSKRTTVAYKAALQYVHEHLISLNGRGFIIDFEKAMRLALIQIVPGINVLGCWFHYCQCLRRKMASLKNLNDLIRDTSKPEPKDLFCRFQCSALLPENDIEPAFLNLCREALKLSRYFNEFIDYFNDEWIRRVTPKHFSVFGQKTRTTGAAESFNAKANKAFRTHANVYHFIEKLQIEELHSTQQLESYADGTSQRDHKKPFYKKRDKFIEDGLNRLRNCEISANFFLKLMANAKNKVLFPETAISVNDIEVGLTNSNELMSGSELQALVNVQNLSFDFDEVEEVAEVEDIAEVYATFGNTDENILDLSTVEDELQVEDEIVENRTDSTQTTRRAGPIHEKPAQSAVLSVSEENPARGKTTKEHLLNSQKPSLHE